MNKIISILKRKNISYEVQKLILGYERIRIDDAHIHLFSKNKNVKIEFGNYHNNNIYLYDAEQFEQLQKVMKNQTFLVNMYYELRREIQDTKTIVNKIFEYASQNDMLTAYNLIYN